MPRTPAGREGLTIAEVGIWRNALSQDPKERKRNTDYCVAQLRLADLVGARCCISYDTGDHRQSGCEKDMVHAGADALDKDMPMILEHLQTDEEYLKVTAYLREVLHGLYQNG